MAVIGTVEGILRLRDEFSSQLARAATQLEQQGKRIQRVGQQMSDVGSKLTQAITLPLAALGGFAVKTAKDFESSFAGVRKTVDATEQEFSALSNQFRELSKTIPVNVNEINAIAESAGQLGIKKQDILAFTRTMADLGQTTNLTANEAAEATAQFQNIFGAAGRDVDRFGATLVALGNAGASTERDILSMGLRIAGAGNQIGLSQGQVLAFASALSSVGIEAEAGGSAISKVMIDIALAVSKGGAELHNFAAIAGVSTSEFQRMFREDAAGAVTAFIEGLGRLKSSGGDALSVLDAMGITEVRMRDALLRAAGAGQLLNDSLTLQAQAWKDNNALTNEAQKRYQTFDSKLTIFLNKLKNVGITLGSAVLPVLTDLLNALAPVIRMAEATAREFANLPKPIRATVVVLGGLAIAAGPVIYILGTLIQSLGTIIATAPKAAAAIGLVRTSLLSFAGPIAAVIGSLIIVNSLLARHNQVQEQYRNALNRSNELLIQSRQHHVDNADALMQEARANLEVLQASLRRQKAEIENIRNVNPFFREDTSAEEQERARRSREERVRADLAATNAAIADTREAMVRLESARSRIFRPEAADVTAAIEPFTLMGKEADDLAKRLAELRQDLILSAQFSNKLADAYGRSIRIEKSATDKRVEQIERSHELHVAYLEDVREFGQAAAEALRPLREADFDAAKAAQEAEEVFNSLKDAVKSVGQAAGEAYTEQLSESIQRGTAKIESDVREIVRRLDIRKQLKLDAEFAIRLSAIDEVSPRLREIEEQYLSFLRVLGQGSVSEGERIFAEMAREFGWTVDQIKGYLESIGDSQAIRQARSRIPKSPLEGLQQEADNYRRLIAEGKLAAEEGAKALASVERDRWNETLSMADQALGYLAGQFGGFFSQLQGLVQNIQGGLSFGSSISSLAGPGGLGLTTGTAGALGSVASVFAIYYAIYDAVDTFTKTNNLKKFGQVNTFTIRNSLDVTNFWDNPDTGRLDEWGRQFASSVSGLVRSIEESLGITIEDLTAISIKFRNDGQEVRAYVEGQLVGLFRDVNSAIEAALQVALRSSKTAMSGLTELMRLGLNVRTPDLEELTRFLQQLREIGDLGLPDAAVQIRETVRHLNEFWVALSRLREVTPAVTQAFSNLVLSEAQAWQRWSDAITGRQQTDQERLAALQNEARIFEAQRDLRVLELKARKAELTQELELLRARAEYARRGGIIGGVILQQQGTELQARAEFAKASGTLVEAQIALLEETIKALDELIAAIEAIPEIDLSKLKLPDLNLGRGGRLSGAGGGSDLAGMIEDSRRQAALAQMTEFERQLVAINDKWKEATEGVNNHGNALARAKKKRDEAIAAANGNADAIKKANEAYQRSVRGIERNRELLEEAARAREEEIRQLEHQTRVAVSGRFAEFLGLTNQFDQIRQTAAELIKEIEASPFGDVRKARMIGRVLDGVNRQIERLAQESAVSLFGSMLQDLEKFGAGESLLNEARRNMAVIEHTLKLNHYRTEIDILKAQGKLSAEVLASLEKSLGFLSSIDPTKVFGTTGWRDLLNKPPSGGGADPADAAQRLADTINKARELLRKYQEDGLDPLTRSLLQIAEDFRQIRAALGNTPEVIDAHAAAIRRALDQFLDPIRQVQQDLFFGENSIADTMTQWQTVQAEFADMQRRFRQGDLSVVQDVPELVQRLIGIAREVTPVGSTAFRDIFTSANRFLNEILAITPDTLGTGNNPMAVAGMADLTVLTEAQLEALSRIESSSNRVADAVESLNYKVGRGGGLANVA